MTGLCLKLVFERNERLYIMYNITYFTYILWIFNEQVAYKWYSFPKNKII